MMHLSKAGIDVRPTALGGYVLDFCIVIALRRVGVRIECALGAARSLYTFSKTELFSHTK